MPNQNQNLQAKKKKRDLALSLLVSLAVIVIVYVFQISNPMMLFIIPVVFFTYSGGYVSGSLSGAIAILYSTYFFFVTMADAAAGQKLLTILLAVITIIVLVGKLKTQDDQNFNELKQAQEKLIQAKEEAEQYSRAKSSFLSMMSHEIRTPMNAIIGMTGIAQKSDRPEKVQECLGRIDEASAHLLGVINDILDMSKIEAGKLELSPSDFVLERMLKRIVNINQVRFEQKAQDFTIFVASDVPTALIADQQRLTQVITNLISNAIKFTPHEGKIELSIHLQEELQDVVILRFEVKDDGIGMTKKQLSHLFRAFEQADNSITRRFGGTGLGLAISKNIIEKMGGSIWVESIPGKGTSFFFEIPVKKGVAAQSSHLTGNVDWKKVRLLTVDASKRLVQYFSAITDSLGIACDTASSSGEALEYLQKRTYQIIFIDYAMPKRDGLSLARRINAAHKNQTMVMMSAYDWSEIEADARKAGIKCFMRKPILPSPLVDCINQCLSESKPAASQLNDSSEINKDIFLGCSMLLVEDLKINREIMKALVEDTGIEVIEAENGQIACELFEQNPAKFDIILMDVHMPLMDGYEATIAIRNKTHLAKAATIPILAMTADVLKEDMNRCLATGMNGHIAKPIDATDLILKLKRCLPTR